MLVEPQAQAAKRVPRAKPAAPKVTLLGAAEIEAQQAVASSDWLRAFELYDNAADASSPESAEELRLRRQAHVARTMYQRLQRLGLERAFIKRGRHA